MNKYKYIIIGNSTAAIGCVEGIRTEDPEGSILVVTDENYVVYGRPLISYYLWGKTTEENMLHYRPEDFYSANGAKLMTGTKAEKIDSKKKTVVLSSGETVKYEKLLVATGSRPFVPPMKGLDSVKNRFSFMTLDDAKALAAAIDKSSRVLIVGAGLIGLKCAEGISDIAGSMTVVDLADRILPSILDEEGSGIIQKFIEEKGVTFYLGDSVDEFKDGMAVLKSGKTVEYDAVIIAVGVRANTELVSDAGGAVNRGIVTDLQCMTTLDDVYAAGDCAESYDITTGQNRVLALLPNAYRQGETAGINMAGGCKLYNDAIPMNSIGFWGLHVITAGSYEGEAVTPTENTGSKYKKLFINENKLKGFILIDDIERAGIYTRLVREQTPLDSIDFEAVAASPQEMAFAKTVRENDLGGAH